MDLSPLRAKRTSQGYLRLKLKTLHLQSLWSSVTKGIIFLIDQGLLDLYEAEADVQRYRPFWGIYITWAPINPVTNIRQVLGCIKSWRSLSLCDTSQRAALAGAHRAGLRQPNEKGAQRRPC